MPFFLIVIAAIIAVAALNNAQGNLALQLEEDVPAFGTWALAVFGVGALGWIPGFATISRYLLALVFVVLVVRNYQQILNGFQEATCSADFGGGGANAGAGASTPAQAYIQNPNAPQITQAQISGTGAVGTGTSSQASASINANAVQPVVSSPYGAFDPTLFVAAVEAGFGGVV